jgi:serine/threonine protein kinase
MTPDDRLPFGPMPVTLPAGALASDGTLRAPSGGLPAGTRLGEFEIVGLIGEGGFGVVYLARDHQLERQVAIKEYMPGALATRGADGRIDVKSERHVETFEAGRRSFINEAKLLAQFDHPSLVKVFRFWEANGTAYMAMPYYRGVTLRNELKRTQEPPGEAWLRQLLDPLIDALQTIHSAHCLHRDIAPDNILMLENGRPLLLDFGAARRVIGDITQALTVILKPGFAPVEQYANGPEMRQGPWTDVYALAAVVYYCATGKAPVPAVSRMMRDTLVPLGQLAGHRYSAEFCAAIDRALTVEVEQRTQSVAELRRDLGAGDSEAAPNQTGQWNDDWLAPESQREPAGDTGAGFSLSDSILPAQPMRSPPPARPAGPPREAPAAKTPMPQPVSAEAGSPWLAVLIGVVIVLFIAVFAGTWWTMQGGTTKTADSKPSGAPATPVTPPPAPATAADPQANAPTLLPPNATSTSPSPAGAAPSGAPFDLDTVLDSVYAGRAPDWQVSVEVEKQTVKIGKDALRFRVRSDQRGYLHILMVPTDRSHYYLIFPNSLDGQNRIEANSELSLPRSSWPLGPLGPPGTDRFVAIVTPTSRDFSPAGLKNTKPFREFDLKASSRAFEQFGAAPFAGRAVGCTNESPDCNRYGAARFDIVEVK